jgi:NAD(P)-dependent dehydrogenase (short-subunit alcohol dehydrogenase family)
MSSATGDGNGDCIGYRDQQRPIVIYIEAGHGHREPLCLRDLLNFTGGTQVSHRSNHFVPGPRERHRGCQSDGVASAAMGPYCASKWALEALSECLVQEVRPFNIRVVIIEPGFIETPIFGKASLAAENSPYPHQRRLRAWFTEGRKRASSPYLIAAQIQQIVEGNSLQLRYPVGAEAVPLINWRASNE